MERSQIASRNCRPLSANDFRSCGSGAHLLFLFDFYFYIYIYLYSVFMGWPSTAFVRHTPEEKKAAFFNQCHMLRKYWLKIGRQIWHLNVHVWKLNKKNTMNNSTCWLFLLSLGEETLERSCLSRQNPICWFSDAGNYSMSSNFQVNWKCRTQKRAGKRFRRASLSMKSFGGGGGGQKQTKQTNKDMSWNADPECNVALMICANIHALPWRRGAWWEKQKTCALFKPAREEEGGKKKYKNQIESQNLTRVKRTHWREDWARRGIERGTAVAPSQSEIKSKKSKEIVKVPIWEKKSTHSFHVSAFNGPNRSPFYITSGLLVVRVAGGQE